MEYIVANVHDNVEQWSWNGKSFDDYAIQLDGVDGWIKLTVTRGGKAPQRGDRIEGTIETKMNKRTQTEYRKLIRQRPNQGYGGDSRVTEQLQEINGKLDELKEGQQKLLDAATSGEKNNSKDDNDFFDGEDPFKP